MTQTAALPSDAEPGTEPDPGSLCGTLRAAWWALLLQRGIYNPLLGAENPFRSGLRIAALIYFVAALAISLGLLGDYLTMPRAALIQERIYEAVIGARVYQAWAAESGFAAALLTALYKVVWFFVRTLEGYPSRFDLIYAFLGTWIFGVFNWITYAWIAQILARRMGAQAAPKVFYAPMALAYAPNLLYIANLVPGLAVPESLVGVWTLATGYQAIQATYGFSWKRSAALVILPYIVTAILLILALVLGAALGVGVSVLIT
jgi:hypothetical protein